MKNMMKILLCLMLVICMALSMVACGDSGEKEPEEAKDSQTESTEESTDESTTEPTTEEDTTEEPSSEEPVISSDSLEGYYSCVMMLPTESIEGVVESMITAMECTDVAVSDLSNIDELNFGFAYYVDITADTMNFTYDYESTQYLFDDFREGLYAAMWEALEKQAELYSLEWADMEQACQDEYGTDVDGYINSLIDTFETELALESQQDQQSTYTAADGIITMDGDEMEYIVDGDEIYISLDGELLFYMIAE